jgi:hypothetical protein
MRMLETAVALSDADLLVRLPALAMAERSATAELVAHLAALRLRPSLYAAQGYGSLFAYCRHALRLSEDTAANRIHAARACLRFPVILDQLASGELSLSAVRMLRPHLTAENHERVLARARNARRVDIQRLVAELAPRPDVPSSVRKLPAPRMAEPEPVVTLLAEPPRPAGPATPPHAPVGGFEAGTPRAAVPEALAVSSVPRPVVQPLSPGRYRVQFTIDQDAHDLLERMRTLLRREIPDGDAGVIFARALRLLHREVEAARFGKATKRRGDTLTKDAAATKAAGNYENRIRLGADRGRCRHVPKAVRRAVWFRDRGQCAFVSKTGHRCGEREYLELHHIQPFALNGPATTDNIALRCRRHNAYEAELVFGARSTAYGQA